MEFELAMTRTILSMLQEAPREFELIRSILVGIGYEADALPADLVAATRIATAASAVPSVEEIARAWLTTRVHSCSCLIGLDLNPIEQCLIHLLGDLNGFPTCDVLLKLREYQILNNGVMPTGDELDVFLTDSYALESDPEAYWLKTKYNIPTPNLGDLPTSLLSAEDNCSVCQEKMCVDTEVYRMPCCGNYFHSDEHACLGVGSSIMTWLTQSKKCPVCGKEVTICLKRKRV
jgi:hypothetical protein